MKTTAKLKNDDINNHEVDIFSASLIDVLKDISKDVGNVGKELTTNALSIIQNSSTILNSTQKYTIHISNFPIEAQHYFHFSAWKRSAEGKEEKCLIEMDPCEFELSGDAGENQLELDGTPLTPDDILVASPSADSVLHYSEGRYAMTEEQSFEDGKLA